MSTTTLIVELPAPELPKPKCAGPEDRMYQAAGKPRPMIILEVLTDDYYKVLKLTGEGKQEDGTLKPGFVELGYLVDDAKLSYTDGSVHHYPSNLVSGTHKLLREAYFASIIKLVEAAKREPLA